MDKIKTSFSRYFILSLFSVGAIVIIGSILLKISFFSPVTYFAIFIICYSCYAQYHDDKNINIGLFINHDGISKKNPWPVRWGKKNQWNWDDLNIKSQYSFFGKKLNIYTKDNIFITSINWLNEKSFIEMVRKHAPENHDLYIAASEYFKKH